MTTPPDPPAHRQTARAVVVHEGRLLVIMRRRQGVHYAVLPGGAIEAGESGAEACVRELWEETGLHGKVRQRLHDSGTDDVTYFELVASGIPTLGYPERDRLSAMNVYAPCWVSLDEISRIGLVPATALEAVRAAIEMQAAAGSP